ncbi:hypothetical protein BCS89_03960 [Vibrio splendidus]|nr:hypothetical protein BCS97_16665 [Vibrio splendidus]PMP20146.1 hypothetical protein BCS89_03960 [Vibrio splendidus]PMP36841.1 hypothetical protein BCS88_05505 [Vibrio splendidus]PMP41712.1 hypothetical protein BCS87_05635 [Vibrio splendidus]PMP45727.1 hypothetical protein BCS85_16820 [Vibrio splendidus]
MLNKPSLAFFFLINFSSLYISDFFPAPYYIFFIAGLIVFLSGIKEFEISRDNIFLLVVLIIFLLVIFLSGYIGRYNEVTIYAIATCLIVFTLSAISRISLENAKFIIISFFVINLFVYMGDAIYRFSTPNLDYLEIIRKQGVEFRWFYAYKHSYLYTDSNFSGLFLAIASISIIQHRRIFGRCFALLIGAYSVLLLLTFSRASIIAFFIGLLYLLFRRLSYEAKLITVTTLSLLSPLFLVLSGFFDFHDTSFTSKIEIVDSFFNILGNEGALSLLFGWGLGNSFLYLGHSAHNLFITIFLELGVIGFVLFILVFSWILLKYELTRPVILVFFISSLSFGFLFSAYISVISLTMLSQVKKISH